MVISQSANKLTKNNELGNILFEGWNFSSFFELFLIQIKNQKTLKVALSQFIWIY